MIRRLGTLKRSQPQKSQRKPRKVQREVALTYVTEIAPALDLPPELPNKLDEARARMRSQIAPQEELPPR